MLRIAGQRTHDEAGHVGRGPYEPERQDQLRSALAYAAARAERIVLAGVLRNDVLDGMAIERDASTLLVGQGTLSQQQCKVSWPHTHAALGPGMTDHQLRSISTPRTKQCQRSIFTHDSQF